MSDSLGVSLPAGDTGSTFLHRLLADAARAFPQDLATASLPAAPARFKATYAQALCRFEAARLAGADRVAVAQHLARAAVEALRVGPAPLTEVLAATPPAPKTETIKASLPPGLRVALPIDGKIYAGAQALSAIDRLRADHHMTEAAHQALHWMVAHIESAGGALDLSHLRFALLGAAAEISPVRLLLQAGATVRWVDVKSPAATLGNERFAGHIIHRAGDDLLGDPATVAASLAEFAHAQPIHLGLFAYAPGASRELRLAAAMNAIAQRLGAKHAASVSLLISPTSPAEVQPEDRAVAEARGQDPLLWQRALQVVRALVQPGHTGGVAQSIVPLQGVGYQAAQYLAKITAAEAWSSGSLGGPVTVSANVAGITNTRSLAHPLFQLAFAGASAFSVRIFEPATTRVLNGLLMLHDLLNPKAPGAASRRYASPSERAKALRSQQIHGGVYDLPWQFARTVQAAALIGLATKPGLLFNRAS